MTHDARAGTKHEPASLCYSTVLDMARFGALHLRGGETLSRMHEPHSDPRLDIDLRYGLGCYLSPARDGVRQIGHEGFYDGMWVKLILDPRTDSGVVWMDNRGEELREERYRLIAELGEGTGRADHTVEPMPGPQVEQLARRAQGDYVRAGAPPLRVERRGQELELRSQDDRTELVPYARKVWRSATRHGPGSPPWGPHAGTDRISFGITADGDGTVPVVHLNGLPYVRREWRDGVTSRTMEIGRG